MKILFYMFLAAGAFFSGCTYNISKNESVNNNVFFARMNTEIEDRNALIQTGDSAFTAGEIKAAKDSLQGTVFHSRYYYHYMEILPSRHFSIPNNRIKAVSAIKRTGSILKGLGLGAAAGGVLGLCLLPPAGGASNSGQHDEPVLKFVAGTLAGFLAGGILGAIVGDEYIFYYDKDSESGPVSRNPAHRFGIKTGYIMDFTTRYIETEGYPVGNTGLVSTPLPGFSLTLFYNFPLNKMFSVNNELTFISAGDDQKYSIIKYNDYRPISSSSLERMTMIQLAPLFKMNLRRTKLIPYILLGPKIDFIVSIGKEKTDFYSEMNRLYGNAFYTTSGEYRRIVYGGALGFGISTGRMLPWEICAELKYNFDISRRFVIDNHFARSNYRYNPEVYQNCRDWTINLGFAFD